MSVVDLWQYWCVTILKRVLRVSVAPLLAVVVLVLSACSGGTSAPPASRSATQPPIGPVSTVTTQQQVVRPIDAYLPTTAELVKLVDIETQKINACLTKNSLPADYAAASDPAQLVPFIAGGIADNVVRNDLWGFFDTNPADYSHYGYVRPPGTPGVLRGGGGGDSSTAQKCSTQADVGLPNKATAMSFTGLGALPGGGPQTPSNDTRWVAAQSKWSSCMTQAGFHYKTPQDAIGDSRWYQREDLGKPPSSLQIATATADIQCKIKTNLVGIGLAIQTAYDQQYIQKNQQALDKYRAEITAYLAQE